MRNLSKQSHYENASKDFKTSDEVVLDDETVNKLREKFTMKNLDNRVEDALPLINKIMSELEAPKGDEDEEGTPNSTIPLDQVNELDPGDEPIDAPVEPAVDHGAIVQSFLTDPESKIMLNKKVPSHVTKYKGAEGSKNSGLVNILSDIASRMLTKTGAEDRVANFASRVADAVSQEGEPFFKPEADHNKNKKIAVQLAQRYLKDRQEIDPADYNPKKDIKGKAHSPTEAFENWVNNIDEYAKTDFQSWLAKNYDNKKVTDLKSQEYADLVVKYKANKDREEKMQKAGIIKREPAFAGEQVTFEDIKPYVSMYKADDGKQVYDVLDKDGESAFKTTDSKAAMAYLSNNFNKLRMSKDEREISQIMKHESKESINESRSKIVAAIKAKADENAQNIAGVDEEIERITQLVNYQ